MPRVSMNRKRLLVALTTLAIVVGLLVATVPFIGSLGISAKTANEARVVYDVSDIEPGQLKMFDMLWVYRRTEKDIERVDELAHLLDDPDSKRSQQPGTLKNKWRSENKDFFIFFPRAPRRACAIEFVAPNQREYKYYEDGKAIQSYPHFVETCELRIFDLSGRLLAREGWPPEFNLTIPETEWISDSKVVIVRK